MQRPHSMRIVPVVAAALFVACSVQMMEEAPKGRCAQLAESDPNSITAACPATQSVSGTVLGDSCIPNSPISCATSGWYLQTINQTVSGELGSPCTFEACCYLPGGADAGDGGAADGGAADGGAGDGGCNARTCPNGCCDEQGRCVAGTDFIHCGTGGAVCAYCEGTTKICFNQSCRACDSTTCPNGCCDGDGICRPGTWSEKCGTGGAACSYCWAYKQEGCVGQRCQRCDATTCPNGCCNSKYECVPGSSNIACGTGGAACTNCTLTANKTCSGQTCQACNATTCPNGCCDALRGCEPGTDYMFCGQGAQACATCRDGQQCLNKQCVACNATNCPNGCCALGQCITPGNRGYCGTGGAACTQCPDGKDCLNGQCQTCNATTCPNGCCTRPSPPDSPFPPSQGGLCAWSSNYNCGTGGALCQTCMPAEVCRAGACVPGVDAGTR